MVSPCEVVYSNVTFAVLILIKTKTSRRFCFVVYFTTLSVLQAIKRRELTNWKGFGTKTAFPIQDTASTFALSE